MSHVEETDNLPASGTPHPKRSFLGRLLELTGADRARLIEDYLRQRLGVWLNASPEQVDRYDIPGLAIRLDQDWLFLSHFLLKDLRIRLYPNELRDIGSIAAFASYLAAELEPLRSDADSGGPERPAEWCWGKADTKPERRNPGIVLILSTPRSGSTLLRVMLAGHALLFSPPELCLLPFGTLGSRDRELQRLGYSFMRLGLEHAVAELESASAEDGAARVKEWSAEDLPISTVYHLLQQKAGPRQIVDKTPMYSASVEWMGRAEDLFEGAKYVFLVRHPYSVIESFLRMRFHRMVGRGWGVWDDDPYLFSAKIWDRWNRNVLAFWERIDPGRRHFVRYEDLVADPEKTLGELCEFLGISFDPALLNPYEEKRMTYAGSRKIFTVGDPNFVTRDRLEASLANWKQIEMPTGVRSITQELATQLGYEVAWGGRLNDWKPASSSPWRRTAPL